MRDGPLTAGWALYSPPGASSPPQAPSYSKHQGRASVLIHFTKIPSFKDIKFILSHECLFSSSSSNVPIVTEEGGEVQVGILGPQAEFMVS